MAQNVQEGASRLDLTKYATGTQFIYPGCMKYEVDLGGIWTRNVKIYEISPGMQTG